MDNLWEEDLYELLSVDESATPEEIKKAYKKLAIELHPDRFPDDTAKREEATVRFGKITNAYNVLKDEEERAEYDFARRLGFAGSGGPPPGSKGAGPKGGKKEEAPKEAAPTGTGPLIDDSGVSEARSSQAQNQFDQGKIAHKGKNWAKAIQHYKEAARLDPSKADYQAYLGLAYTQQGLKTPAQKAFEQAYKLDKKHPVLKEHYTPPGEKGKKDAKGGGLLASIMALFGGGGSKDAKGKDAKGKAKGKDAKGKDAKKKGPAGKKAAGKR